MLSTYFYMHIFLYFCLPFYLCTMSICRDFPEFTTCSTCRLCPFGYLYLFRFIIYLSLNVKPYIYQSLQQPICLSVYLSIYLSRLAWIHCSTCRRCRSTWCCSCRSWLCSASPGPPAAGLCPTHWTDRYLFWKIDR